MTIATLWGHQLKEPVPESVVGMVVGRLGRERLIPVNVILLTKT